MYTHMYAHIHAHIHIHILAHMYAHPCTHPRTHPRTQALMAGSVRDGYMHTCHTCHCEIAALLGIVWQPSCNCGEMLWGELKKAR